MAWPGDQAGDLSSPYLGSSLGSSLASDRSVTWSPAGALGDPSQGLQAWSLDDSSRYSASTHHTWRIHGALGREPGRCLSHTASNHHAWPIATAQQIGCRSGGAILGCRSSADSWLVHGTLALGGVCRGWRGARVERDHQPQTLLTHDLLS